MKGVLMSPIFACARLCNLSAAVIYIDVFFLSIYEVLFSMPLCNASGEITLIVHIIRANAGKLFYILY